MDSFDDQRLFDDEQNAVEQAFVDEDIASGLTGAINGFSKQDIVELEHLDGKVLNDKFLVEACVGSGAAGTVFAATDQITSRKVAVKVLSKSASRDAANERRFMQETRVTRFLKHQNIVRVYEYGEEGDHPYFVMDFLAGGSLKDRIEKGPLSIEDFIKVLKQAAEGIAFAHKQGVIHRDIKPHNMMFVDETYDELRILDFGVSKTTTWDIDKKVLETDGRLFGTPVYFAPERASGKEADERSDIYSLGIVMYECLTGKPPHVGSNAIETLMFHQTKNAEPISKLRQDCPRGIEYIVMKMLLKRPQDRYQSLSDVLSDLEKHEKNSQEFLAELTASEKRKSPKEPNELSQKKSKLDDLEVDFRKPDLMKGRLAKLPVALIVTFLIGVFLSLIGVAFSTFDISRILATEQVVEGVTYYYSPASSTRVGEIYLWVKSETEDSPGMLVKIEIPVSCNLDDKSASIDGAQVGDPWRISYRVSHGKNLLIEARLPEDDTDGEDLKQIQASIKEMFGVLATDSSMVDELADYYVPDWKANDYQKLKDTWSNSSFNVVGNSQTRRSFIKVESYDKGQGKASVLIRTKFWIRSGPQYMRFVMIKSDNRKWLIGKVEEIAPTIWENDGAGAFHEENPS